MQTQGCLPELGEVAGLLDIGYHCASASASWAVQRCSKCPPLVMWRYYYKTYLEWVFLEICVEKNSLNEVILLQQLDSKVQRELILH